MAYDELSKLPTNAHSIPYQPGWSRKSHWIDLLPLLIKVTKSVKMAVVTPLLKKPQELLKNYRPVSNLPFLSKILELTVAMRLNKYMDEHQLHDPSQFAYKAGHSAETALIKVQNDLPCPRGFECCF